MLRERFEVELRGYEGVGIEKQLGVVADGWKNVGVQGNPVIVPVALQANPFPYLQGFTVVGNPELTTASGGFSFPVLGLQQVTQFRVVTISGHRIVSPVTVPSVLWAKRIP